MHNTNRMPFRLWRKHGERRFAPRLTCLVCHQEIRFGREAEHRGCVKQQEAQQATPEAPR